MKRLTTSKAISIITFMMLFLACSTMPDITNEENIMNDIQGNWVGYEKTGDMYRHVKLKITKNLFEAWTQMSDHQEEPVWSDLPDEKGIISLNSLQKDNENNIRFRKFAFTCNGRCCGDKSISVVEISKLISYQEGRGLTIGQDLKMSRK